MQVTVSLWYVVGCELCAAEVDRITRAAVRDVQVTKLTLAPGHKHNHPESQVDSLPATGSLDALEAAGQQIIPGTLDALAFGAQPATLTYGPETIEGTEAQQ